MSIISSFFNFNSNIVPFWNDIGFPNFSFFAPESSSFPNFANSNFFTSSVWNVEQFNEPQKSNTKIANPVAKNNERTTSNNTSIFKDYDVNAGNKLANIALRDSVGFTGHCARGVKTAIKKADLGAYQSGHAYQMDDILRKNDNFKEISPESVDVKKLPAGCVLVYDKGVQGYSASYGHTEITTGDGRAVSDGITNNLYKKPSSIFIPVIA